MKYFIIAGEASGDLHASNLIKELKKLDGDANFHGWGGDLMMNQGASILKHYRDLAFMGIIEVVQNIRTIMRNFTLCKKHLLQYGPDVLILVDYPGFNLRMAKFAKQYNIPVCYYISPKAWVWKESRAYKVKKYVDRLFCIFPFEVGFYKKFNYQAFYVGNPVVDAIEDFKKVRGKQMEEIHWIEQFNKPVIALLAGSRYQEINLLLPEMISISKNFPDYCFVVAGAPSIPKSHYQRFLNGTGINIVYDKTYELLSVAKAAVVTSGTATLETALFDVPQIVIYKTNEWSFNIGQVFIWLGTIKLTFFSLVNIILNKEAVKEILQHHVAEKTTIELKKILTDDNHYKNIRNDYQEMKKHLGNKGASSRVATGIYQYVQSLKK